ncbi:MAG: Chain length determinant protein [Syntrophorhabdus sp. PtaU1.Bin050]|nr:MAG: Chain length determinant protein [Syntrophorhabdus sp. PtaU1.Bin050]
MEQKTESFNLRDVLTILFRHKYKIVSIFLIVCAITAIVAILQPVYYAARSVIMVKFGRENIQLSEGPGINYPMVNETSMINTEIQIIGSLDLLCDVVVAAGVYNVFPDLKQSSLKYEQLREVAGARLKQDLAVKPIPQSNTFEVYVRNKNPYVAQKTLIVLLDKFKEKHMAVFSDSKSTFLQDQVKLYEKQLREAEAKLADFKDKHDITNLNNQFFFIVAKQTDLQSALRVEESRLNEIKEKIAFLKNQKRKVVSDLYTSTTRTTLTNLRSRETALLQTYKENARPVRNIRKEIETVQEQLRKYEEESKESGEWVAIEAEVGPQQLKIQGLKEQVTNLNKQLQELTANAAEANRLEREIALNQANYDTYVKKYEESRISEDLERRKITNIRVVEPPTVSLTPLKEQRKTYAKGIFVAIVLSLGIAVFAEFGPQRVTTPERAERLLRLPLLVSIGHKNSA